MEVQPLETIIAELVSDDWLKTGCAINKLIPHDEAATRALPIVFELTLHDKAPVRSYSSALIRRLGKHAVPFLRDKAADECPDHRAMAITLLTETGCRWATSTRLVEQILDDRRDDLPDWGANPEEIIQLFKTALDDDPCKCVSMLRAPSKNSADTFPKLSRCSSRRFKPVRHTSRTGRRSTLAASVLQLSPRLVH
jgi:hypothetical protein